MSDKESKVENKVEKINGDNSKGEGNGQTQMAPVQVHAQYVKDLSFENPNSPDSILGGWGAPETHVQVNIQYRPLNEENKMFEVVLLFRIEAKNKEQDKTAFIVELAYGCAVSLGELPKDNIEPVLMIELPKLLFPFAREIIANAAIHGGYPPLYIQPINFESVYVQRLQQQRAEAEKRDVKTDDKKEDNKKKAGE